MAGYSRLMQDDEAATVTTLEAHKQAFSDLIKQHRGRVVDSPGDNLLAEFASVVDAVQCAVAVQKELQARNAELPENRRMLFRIGVNLGDVIEEESRIYGDGVNIAARLESLADPGGICVSKTAFDHIESKLPLGYEFLGEQTVKNIARPVGAYRVVLEPRVTRGKGSGFRVRGSGRRMALAALTVVLAAAVGVGLWHFLLRPAAPVVEKADPQKMAFPLPDKPSIAVLPFTNMSEDKDQEYFADGLTDEIINGLSKVEHVFVIARNSTFTYKNKPVKVQQVAEEMGVRYVLEGSVRKTGDTVRITTQLADAVTGRHLFSERYDRDFRDILTVQDEIAMKVLVAVQVVLTKGEVAQLPEKEPKNLQAYLSVLKSQKYNQQFNRESVALARRHAEEAIAQDPEYSGAYRALAAVMINETFVGAAQASNAETRQQALMLAEKAVALDPTSSNYFILSLVHVFFSQDPEKARSAAERSIALSPNSASAFQCMGASLMLAERYHEAIPYFEKSLRLSPIPVTAGVMSMLGNSLRFTGKYEEAIAVYRRMLTIYPNTIFGHAMLACTYATVGRHAEARAEAAEVLKLDPGFTSSRFVSALLVRRNKQLVDDILSDLGKAGLN